jgi:hypothetical protein
MTQAARFNELRRLADYLQAVDNEIAIDRAALSIAGLDPQLVGHIPRASKWAAKVQGRAAAVRRLSVLASWAWRVGLSQLYHLLQFFKAWRQRGLGRRAAAPVSARGFALLFSPRSAEIIQHACGASGPSCWVSVPWVRPTIAPAAGVKVVDAFSLLSAGDLFGALASSLRAVRAMNRGQRAPWVLQSFTAFKWFAARRAIARLDGRLVTSEHFDRWAVLADGVARELKSRYAASGGAGELVVVQHGSLGGLSAEAPSDLLLKRRLRQVTSLFVYDAQSEQAFKQQILSAACRHRCTVRYFRPRVVLRPTPAGDAIRVLFVGHPFCESLHVHVLHHLKKALRIAAFYKPHPIAQPSADIDAQDWLVIRDKTHYPEVDLLVSYPSTLVVEYAAVNIPAAVHPMDLAAPAAAAFVTSTAAQLDLLAASRRQANSIQTPRLQPEQG